MKIRYRILAAVMTAVMMMTVFAGCRDSGEEDALPADYGSYGADFARELASAYPCRTAYSQQERDAAEMIRNEFSELGFEPEIQTLTSIYGQTSVNVIVRLSGRGFFEEQDGEYVPVRRTAIIGAHYDNAYSPEQVPSDRSYDGISDNASGIGCLMTIAANIQSYIEATGYDVILVAFGAGSDNYAGARAFYSSLSTEELRNTDVMYCIENIYAGDKMYANAGMSSLDMSRKYSLRRKLYQAYDVAYDAMLSSLNGYNLLYNESNIITDLNGDGSPDIYREVSVHRSDYVVFDEAGIPIVFFDSGDYFFDSLDEYKETKNLNLQEFGGMISGTFLDSSEILDPILVTEEQDLLQVRVNNTAFVILESLLKGSDTALTYEQYDEILRAAETYTPEEETVVTTT